LVSVAIALKNEGTMIVLPAPIGYFSLAPELEVTR